MQCRYSDFSITQKLLCSMGPAASALTVDFVVNLKDECRSPIDSKPLPVMGPHKSAMFRDILFPFPEFYRDWDGMVASMRKAAVPWDSQKVRQSVRQAVVIGDCKSIIAHWQRAEFMLIMTAASHLHVDVAHLLRM